MTDAEFDAQKARIQALIEKWSAVLGLKWWNVSYEYVQSSDDMPEGASAEVLAKCSANWMYLSATVTWNLANAKGCDDAYLEDTFVHESVHILVNEMRADQDSTHIDHEERVTTTLTRAFLWVRDTPPAKTEAKTD